MAFNHHKNSTNLVLNRDEEGHVIPEEYDPVQAESNSDEDTAKAYRLSQANTMLSGRNLVSKNEELFIKSASDEDKKLYKQLNDLIGIELMEK